MITLKDKLKERERALGLTQVQVAAAAGLSAERYSHYITGRNRPNYDDLLRICKILKTSPNYLLGFEPEGVSPYYEQLTNVAAHLNDTQLEALISIADGFLRSRNDM